MRPGERLGVLDSMRDSVAGLAGHVCGCSWLVLVGGIGPARSCWCCPGCAALVCCSSPGRRRSTSSWVHSAALRRSVALVRGRFFAVAGILGAALAAVLVFMLLTGILLAVVMSLAGPGAQTGHTGLSVSRWLMAALLALPVVYVGAVSVAAWRTALSVAPASPGDPGPPPAQ